MIVAAIFVASVFATLAAASFITAIDAIFKDNVTMLFVMIFMTFSFAFAALASFAWIAP